MRSHTVSQRFVNVLMLTAAVVATAALGAWESISPSPTASAEQRSVFVQSEGATNDVEPSLPEATSAVGHARASSQPQVAATTL